jgi:site-specific DNA-adenine methylase
MMTTYPGGKAGSGVYQAIINQIPPHHIYIELFAGHAAILRAKRPAAASIAVDASNDVLLDLQAILEAEESKIPSLTLINRDAMKFLDENPSVTRKDTFIYVDPPYLFETRSGGSRRYYQWEFGEREQHEALLFKLRCLPCMVAISGYQAGLYDELLVGWRKITFPAMTRGGRQATEVLWMNYPEPVELHDYSYLGNNFRERERIKRKKARWYSRLRKMPLLERYALMATIDEIKTNAD